MFFKCCPGKGLTMKIYYNPRLKSFARELRNNSTLSEVLLREQLKECKLGGFQFARQKPIGEYIVDFFCPRLGMVIEIDGEATLTAGIRIPRGKNIWSPSDCGLRVSLTGM